MDSLSLELQGRPKIVGDAIDIDQGGGLAQQELHGGQYTRLGIDFQIRALQQAIGLALHKTNFHTETIKQSLITIPDTSPIPDHLRSQHSSDPAHSKSGAFQPQQPHNAE